MQNVTNNKTKKTFKKLILQNSSIDYYGLITMKYNQELIVPDLIKYALDVQSNISTRNVSL